MDLRLLTVQTRKLLDCTVVDPQIASAGRCDDMHGYGGGTGHQVRSVSAHGWLSRLEARGVTAICGLSADPWVLEKV